jgi:hypothetical protein
MRRFLTITTIAISLGLVSGAAIAGARPPSTPTGFSSAPTNDQIRDRLRDICNSLVQSEDKVSPAVSGRRCGCYASGVTKAMTVSEFDEMRVTGKFAPSAAPKAKKFMTSCRVKT